MKHKCKKHSETSFPFNYDNDEYGDNNNFLYTFCKGKKINILSKY